MEEKKFYVYKWYNIETNEVFYIGKGCKNRYNQIKTRNQIFKDYYNTHRCAVEKIEYFDTEEAALKKEHELIIFYKSQNQCIANLDDGGRGGLSFIWTPEMRKYKSIYNVMKLDKNKERMRTNNPMKNLEIAEKVAQKIRRPVIINGQFFSGVSIAAEYFNTSAFIIGCWCKRGYDTNGQPCHYADEKQKEYSDTIKQLGARAQSAKGVIVDGIYYPSVKQGAAAINVWPETLIRAMKHNRPCKGHTCNYANQQPSQENNQKGILKGSETSECG